MSSNVPNPITFRNIGLLAFHRINFSKSTFFLQDQKFVKPKSVKPKSNVPKFASFMNIRKLFTDLIAYNICPKICEK